jgi:hypothetical protein
MVVNLFHDKSSSLILFKLTNFIIIGMCLSFNSIEMSDSFYNETLSLLSSLRKSSIVIVLNLQSTSLRLSTFLLEFNKLKRAFVPLGPNVVFTNVRQVSSSLYCKDSKSTGNSASSTSVSWMYKCLIYLFSI